MPVAENRSGSGGSGSNKLKEKSVCVMDRHYDADDVIKAVEGDIGKSNILGCVKTAGQWIVTLSNDEDVELLQETGLLIGDDTCEVMGLGRNIVTVSLFDVPTFVNDDDLSAKLKELGCEIKSPWTHKHYAKYPNIENGIRYVRLQLPNKRRSLPYAITIGDIHLRLKHNGQTKVCNNCLGEGHIMRNCPDYKCKNCNLQGHTESRCPKTKCFKCNEFGHKSFHCQSDKRQQIEDDRNKPDEQMESENVDTESNFDVIKNVSQPKGNQNSEIGEQNTGCPTDTHQKSTPEQDKHPDKPIPSVRRTNTPSRERHSDKLPLSDPMTPIANYKPESDTNKVKNNAIQPLKRTLSIDEDGFSQVTSYRFRKSTKKKPGPNLTNVRNRSPKE